MARQEGFPRETTRPSAPGASTPGVTDKVQETASQVVDKVQQSAAPVVDQASEKAGQVVEKATEQVSSRLDMGKDYAAEALTGVAQALRQTGQHLRQESAQPMLGQYADTGAEQLERFTGYLRQHDANELLSEIESFARRSPTVFAGGAFALGLLAARFFRSTGQPRQPTPPARMGMPSGYRPPVAPPSARPPTLGPTPRPATSQPPRYAGGGSAARTVAPSTDWMPSERPAAGTSPSGAGTTGAGATGTGREAERLTPTPGSPPSTGTPSPPTGAAPAAPKPDTGPSTGTTPPSSERPAPTTRPRV